MDGTKDDFCTWHCREGHEVSAPCEAIEVWCPKEGHTGTNRMKRKDLFPNWKRKESR